MEKKKRGRKSKYETHVKPRFSDIKKWCQRGATDKEIIKLLGIGKTAFYEYLNKYTELTELIEKNRVNPVEEIKASLYKKAIGFTYTETKTTKNEFELDDSLKTALVEVGIDVNTLTKPKQVKTEITVKHALPDVASCLVLLKHWAKDEGWTNDPQTLALKREEFEQRKKEFEHKKEIDDKNIW